MEGSVAREASSPVAAADLAERVVAGLATVMHAPSETLRLPLLCLLAEGHVAIRRIVIGAGCGLATNYCKTYSPVDPNSIL